MNPPVTRPRGRPKKSPNLPSESSRSAPMPIIQQASAAGSAPTPITQQASASTSSQQTARTTRARSRRALWQQELDSDAESSESDDSDFVPSEEESTSESESEKDYDDEDFDFLNLLQPEENLAADDAHYIGKDGTKWLKVCGNVRRPRSQNTFTKTRGVKLSGRSALTVLVENCN